MAKMRLIVWELVLWSLLVRAIIALFSAHCQIRATLGASRFEKPNVTLPATGKLLTCVRAVVVFTGFVRYLTFVRISFPALERRAGEHNKQLI